MDHRRPPLEPLPISTAPRDGSEILLISYQPYGSGRIISIYNGHWSDKDDWGKNLAVPGFVLGDKGAHTDTGDAVASHWLPVDIFDFGNVSAIEKREA